jgi:hypothetical protein
MEDITIVAAKLTAMLSIAANPNLLYHSQV